MATGYRWAAPAPRLTVRQQECVALVWRGLRNKEIAAALGLAEATVGQHLEAAAARLGLNWQGSTRTRLALWLIKECQRATGIRLGARAIAQRE